MKLKYVSRFLITLVLTSGFIFSEPALSQPPKKKLPPRKSQGGPPPSSSSSSSTSSNLSASEEALVDAAGNAISSYFVNKVTDWGENRKRFDIGMSYDSGIKGPTLSLQYRTPIVLGLIARGGYNLDYNKMTGNNKQLLWSAGLQFWMKHWNLFEMGVGDFYFKNREDISLGLYFSTNYTQKVVKHLGINAGIGFVISAKDLDHRDHSDPDHFLLWHAGLVYRFFL